MSAHYVYRIYDVTGRLIYVGTTRNLVQRLKTHSKSSWFSDQCVKAVAKVYPTKRDALTAELSAIHRENPRWNVQGKYRHSEAWGPEDYVDYVTALLNAPSLTPAVVKHMHIVARRYRFRTGKPLPLHLPPLEDATPIAGAVASWLRNNPRRYGENYYLKGEA